MKKRARHTISFLLLAFSLLPVFSRASSQSTFHVSILPAPACADGQDNDDDTFVDFPDDPDCDSALDDSEEGAAPHHGGGGGSTNIHNEDGTISFSGDSFPGSTVVVLKDGVKVGETLTDVDNHFSFTLSSVTPGTYNFSLYTIAEDGDQTTPFAFVLTSNAGSLTSVADILMPPEVHTDKITVKAGDTFMVYGFIVPEATTTLYLDGMPLLLLPQHADGKFSTTLSTSTLLFGTHSVRAQSVLGSAQSPLSRESIITVGEETVFTPTVSATTGDTNTDGRIDIIDLSVMAYWFNKIGFPEVLDIIPDGKIDILDLSVLAYHWTG